jgi:hypothetical protein
MFFYKFLDIFYYKIFEYTSSTGIAKKFGLIFFIIYKIITSEVEKQCFFPLYHGIKNLLKSNIIRNEDVSRGVEVEIFVQHDVEATCTNF